MQFIQLVFESNIFDLKPIFLGRFESDFDGTPVMLWKSDKMYFVFDLEHESSIKTTYHRGILEAPFSGKQNETFPFSKLSYKEIGETNAFTIFSVSANIVKEFLNSHKDFTVKVEGARKDNETHRNPKTTRTLAFERACKKLNLNIKEDLDDPNIIYITL